jgi:hypothetical protein
MYDDVYERLCEAGIEEKLDGHVWRDEENIIVETHADVGRNPYGRNYNIVVTVSVPTAPLVTPKNMIFE